MKKVLLLVLFALCNVVITSAQNVVVSNYGSYSSPSTASSNANNNQFDSRIRDYSIGISTKTDTYGISVGFADEEDLGYGVIGASVGTGDFESFSLTFGYGLDFRTSGDVYMISANIYPYAGLLNYDTINSKLEKVNKWKFNYGLAGGLKLGYNVYTSPSGSKHYITVEHTIGAPEFETHNMVDNGAWRLGLTIKY